MTFKKNSLSLFLGYFALLILQQLSFQLIHNNNFLYPLLTALNLGGAVTLAWLASHFKYSNQVEKTKKHLFWYQNLIWIGGGTLLTLFFQKILLWFETVFLSQPVISQNTSQLMAVAAKYPYYLIMIVLTEPIIEELIFRKVLFGNFTYWFKPWQTALFSSLLFSLAHGDGHYLTYATIGLILCLVYSKTGKVSASMASHILMNLIVLLLN